MTPVSVSQLARNDHKRGRRKSGVAIANALGGNYHMLSDSEQDALIDSYETAWWTADKKAEVTV